MHRYLPTLNTAIRLANLENRALIAGFPSLHPIARLPWNRSDAMVRAGDRTYKASVAAISPGGLRLADVPELKPGQAVSIRCSDGIEAHGNVCWFCNGEAGIKLAA